MEQAVTREIRRRYPMHLTDLTKPELTQLTDILLLENPPAYQIAPRPGIPEKTNETIREMIKVTLPADLRKSTLMRMMPKVLGRAANLCTSHKELNAFVIGDILNLVKDEVTERVAAMDQFVDAIPAGERQSLRDIQGIRRIWGDAVPIDLQAVVNNAPSAQGNRCEACMLARIANDPLLLRNLRVALLGRNKTRGNHKAPRLLAFIDGCINCHAGCSFQTFYESNQLSMDFKLARKAAKKARNESGHRANERRVARKSSAETINVYLHPALHSEYLDQQRTSQPESSNDAARTFKGKDRASRDTLADDIIPYYEQGPHDETQVRASEISVHCVSNLKGKRAVGPSSSESSSSASSSATIRGNTGSTMSSHNMLDWQRVMHHGRRNRRSLPNKMQNAQPVGHRLSEGNGRYDLEALAAEYRDLIDEYSESEYSQLEDGRLSSRGTTWSLFLWDGEN